MRNYREIVYKSLIKQFENLIVTTAKRLNAKASCFDAFGSVDVDVLCGIWRAGVVAVFLRISAPGEDDTDGAEDGADGGEDQRDPGECLYGAP